MLGNFLSCVKCVKVPFEAQEGRWDFSRDAAAENSLISRTGENLLVFLELRQETWSSSRVKMGTSRTHLCCLRKVQSPCELQTASLDSSPVETGISGNFLSCIKGVKDPFKAQE